jgi:hypothetical protein
MIEVEHLANPSALERYSTGSAARPTEELTPMRGLPTRPLGAAAVALGLAGLFAVAARVHHYRLETATPPASFLRDGRVDVVIEPSGVAPLEAAQRAQGLDAAQVAERKIEGLAIREGGGRRELVFGLREPDDKVPAFAADITDAPSPDAALELRPLFAFDAGRREGFATQLTSLEYVPAMGGFLVLTTAVGADKKSHGNTLWLVANGERRQAREYATFEAGMTAAGLAVLGVKQAGRRTEIKLVITYDNDPHATRIPSRFQTAMLVHERS